jgi:hypothetical protein
MRSLDNRVAKLDKDHGLSVNERDFMIYTGSDQDDIAGYSGECGEILRLPGESVGDLRERAEALFFPQMPRIPGVKGIILTEISPVDLAQRRHA